MLLGVLSGFEKVAVASKFDILLKSKLEFKGALSVERHHMSACL